MLTDQGISNNLPRFNKTRIAPTPSGYLHLGNVLSFAITAALARQTGAKILLRIDDMDQERVNLQYVQDVFDTLNFLNIPWDEGPRDVDDYQQNWSQLQRMDLYRDALQQLEDGRDIFACKCSRSQLQGNSYAGTCRKRSVPLDTPNTSWRLYTDDRNIRLKTLNDGLVQTRLPDTMKDFVVKKKDDNPAYQLSSLLDDVHYGVDLIVRGQDLYPSTIAQHFLADVLGEAAFQNITFYHHPLLMLAGDVKLSKSAGATSVKYMREQRRSATAIYAEIGKMLGIRNELRSFEDFTRLI